MKNSLGARLTAASYFVLIKIYYLTFLNLTSICASNTLSLILSSLHNSKASRWMCIVTLWSTESWYVHVNRIVLRLCYAEFQQVTTTDMQSLIRLKSRKQSKQKMRSSPTNFFSYHSRHSHMKWRKSHNNINKMDLLVCIALPLPCVHLHLVDRKQ